MCVPVWTTSHLCSDAAPAQPSRLPRRCRCTAPQLPTDSSGTSTRDRSVERSRYHASSSSRRRISPAQSATSAVFRWGSTWVCHQKSVNPLLNRPPWRAQSR